MRTSQPNPPTIATGIPRGIDQIEETDGTFQVTALMPDGKGTYASISPPASIVIEVVSQCEGLRSITCSRHPLIIGIIMGHKAVIDIIDHPSIRHILRVALIGIHHNVPANGLCPEVIVFRVSCVIVEILCVGIIEGFDISPHGSIGIRDASGLSRRNSIYQYTIEKHNHQDRQGHQEPSMFLHGGTLSLLFAIAPSRTRFSTRHLS